MAPSTILGPADITTHWVFAYGSLIWNPEFDYEHSERARLCGYHRAFCISSTRYRGTPEQPGVVLGLDHGGSCVGLAYRLRPSSRCEALVGLFEREMPSAADRVYRPRIVRVDLACGEPAWALAFIADRESPRYDRLSEDEVLRRLSCCAGARGSNRDYAINTWRALEARGFVDPQLRRIGQSLSALGGRD